MAPRRRCPVCGSKQWHKEPSGGLIACSEGHVLQNYRTEERDVLDLQGQTVRTRHLKSTRKKKERLSTANALLYHGDRARYHYFQCLQLLLRMQIAALIKLWELPQTFESVCRDLWALHLKLLPQPPPAAPLEGMEDEEASDSQKPAGENADKIRHGRSANDETAQSSNDEEAKDSGDESSSSSSESSGEDDEELAALMRENSETPSSSEDEHQPKRSKEGVSKKSVVRSTRRYDSPASNVAVLVLACWTMRIPITYIDFTRLIDAYELPYLDPIRLLPSSMTVHLTKQTTQALSPHYAPKPLLLHNLASRFARLLYANYEIATPEMNTAPILWRTVRGMCGTPSLYALAKKIAQVLSVPLTLHRSLAQGFARGEQNDSGWRRYDNAPPEVSLVVAVIIVLKLVYGLDGIERQPREKIDPALALPRLLDYLACIAAADKWSKADDMTLFSAESQTSVLELGETTLDKYLEFCERALLPRNENRSANRIATEFFPLVSVRPSNIAAQGRVANLGANEVPPMAPPPLGATVENRAPGEAYRIYNAQDILGDLPDDLEVILNRAADITGVDSEYLCGVLERFERRLVRWWDTVRKKERDAAPSIPVGECL